MTQKLVTESPEKTKLQIAWRETSPASAQSFQGGLHPIAQLQRRLGNQRVAQLIQAKQLTPEGKIIDLQRKLTVGAADDQYEQEADRVARQVMNTPDTVAANSMQRALSSEEDKDKMLQTKPLAASITPFVQREMANIEEQEDKDKPVQAKFLTETSRESLQRQPEADEEEKEPIQAKFVGSMSGSFEAGDDVETQISQSKGRGSPLPDPVRTYMEPRFGADFSQVRVHTGSDALQMNREVGAQAFTHGSNIYFGAGQSPTNLELTAHELTHVVQQTGGMPLQTKKQEQPVAPLALRHLSNGVVLRAPKASTPCPTCVAYQEEMVQRQAHQEGGSLSELRKGPLNFLSTRIQRVIGPTHDLTHGTFNVTATPQDATAGGPNVPITIKFTPKTTAPISNQIGLIQIVKLTNAAGTNVEPQSLPAARGASLRTQTTDATGVQAGFFTDVLHNPTATTNLPAGGANQGDPLAPQYVFGNGPAQPNPATPGLSRPDSKGFGGAIIGFKRSDDPADIKAAEITDAPGGNELDFTFETVAKGEDTQTIYGAMHWSFQTRGGKVQNDTSSAVDTQSATFDAALQRHEDFYVHEPVIFYFEFDRDTLSSAQIAKIATFKAYLARFAAATPTNPKIVRVSPEGFADQRGNAAYNLDLSLRRASAVRNALLTEGIPEAQIDPVTVGLGATTAFTTDATTDQDKDANRQFNRRVVLTFKQVTP